nr:ribonuclease p protein subunit p29 [Quercus suber]
MAAVTTEHVSEALLRRAHSPETAETIFRERVRQRPLHLRPTSPDRNENARAKRQRERLQKERKARKSRKPAPLSAKQKRALAIYDIPKSQQKYSIYVPLHDMWCKYMRDILGLRDSTRSAFVTPVSAGPILVSADYHGALLEVVRSRCPSRVGLKGVVVKDTMLTFEICTTRDVVKVCPKEHTIFAFEIPVSESRNQGEKAVATTMEVEEAAKHDGSKPLRFEIHGNQFRSRAFDRANRKYFLEIRPNEFNLLRFYVLALGHASRLLEGVCTKVFTPNTCSIARSVTQSSVVTSAKSIKESDAVAQVTRSHRTRTTKRLSRSSIMANVVTGRLCPLAESCIASEKMSPGQ